MVFFKFNEHLTDEKEQELLSLLKDFKDGIPGIVEMTFGINVSDEIENIRGYTLGIRLTFDSKKSLDEYGPHPVHQKFVQALDGVIEDVVVVDYPI